MGGIYDDIAKRENYHIAIIHFNYHDNYSMTRVQLHNYRVGGGGDTPQCFWLGCAARTLESVRTLLQTKICDFPYPISDLSQNSIPHFRPLNLIHGSII